MFLQLASRNEMLTKATRQVDGAGKVEDRSSSSMHAHLIETCSVVFFH